MTPGTPILFVARSGGSTTDKQMIEGLLFYNRRERGVAYNINIGGPEI